MTLRDVLGVLLRRWRVVVIGLLCTVCAMGAVVGREGVYATQVDVILLAPIEPNRQNVFVGSLDSLINFTAIIERELNPGPRKPRLTSPTATLYGRGVRDGYSIEMPNTGGQWTNNFSRPVLNVQVVGPSEAEVRATLDSVIVTIDDTITARERAAGADPSRWVSVELAPTSPAIGYVPGEGKRAALAFGALGSAGTLLAAVQIDRWRSRRAGARRPVAP